MKTKYLAPAILIFGLLSVSIFSCRKYRDKPDTSEVAQQNSLAQLAFFDLAYLLEQVIKGPQYFNNNVFSGDCATLVYDTTAYDMITATVDYGSTDCLCKDGKKRRGKLIMDFPVEGQEIGAVSTTTTSGYYVNGSLIEGTRTATVKKENITQIVSKASITPSGNIGTITWNSDIERIYITNPNSPNVIAGREYDVSGSSNGTTLRGDDFTIEITKTLRVQSGCRWIKDGISTIRSSGFKNEATLDYGDGSCDNKATLKYDDEETTISL